MAGAYLKYTDGTVPKYEKMEFLDTGDGRAVVTYGDLTVELCEDRVKIRASRPFELENRIGLKENHFPECLGLAERELKLSYKGVEYAIVLCKGHFDGENSIFSEGHMIEIKLK